MLCTSDEKEAHHGTAVVVCFVLNLISDVRSIFKDKTSLVMKLLV
jgi:hypothetical protein